MKVLLTGASGFVGSHVLDSLCRRKLPTVILTRPNCNPTFFKHRCDQVEIRHGTIVVPQSLSESMQGITHVVHCAGATKAATPRDFYTVNRDGTRNLAKAAGASGSSVRAFLHISSLAAAGPSLPGKPVTEADAPRPVSEYGRSKLAAEQEVQKLCPDHFTIVRPPAVYGPRDREFLALFKAVRNHILPRPAPQPLSLVYVEDLAEVIVELLLRDGVAGKTFFACSSETPTARDLAATIAHSTGSWTCPLPLPTFALWALCFARELQARLTGTPSVLSLQKYAELRAPGWACSPDRLRQETGLECRTGIVDGTRQTLNWYRTNKWL